MGIRSAVGFCFAPDIEVPKFEDIEPDWKFDKIIRDERGTLYFIDEIKWYNNGTTQAVEKFMNLLDVDDDLCEKYLFIEMYPGDGYGLETEVRGGWWNNDFGLGYISRVCYDDEIK